MHIVDSHSHSASRQNPGIACFCRNCDRRLDKGQVFHLSAVGLASSDDLSEQTDMRGTADRFKVKQFVVFAIEMARECSNRRPLNVRHIDVVNELVVCRRILSNHHQVAHG